MRRQHEVDHPAQLLRLELAHRSEMRRLQADHDQKISDMTRDRQDAEEVIMRLVEKEEEAARGHQRQLRDLEQNRQIQLQKMKEMSEKHHAAEDCYKSEIGTMVTELKAAKCYYQEKLQKLDKQLQDVGKMHARATEVIHARHEFEMLAMAEAHKKEISTYETKMQSQTFKFHKNMDATLVRHAAEIHAV